MEPTEQRAEEIVRSMLTQCATPAQIVQALADAGLMNTAPVLEADAAWQLDMLRAVCAALDLPHAATVEGGQARQQLLEDRATSVVIALHYLLSPSTPSAFEGRGNVQWLREQLAERPLTGYVTHDQAQAALAEGKTWAEATTLPGGER